MLCQKCMESIPYGSRYCEKCGEEISAEQREKEYNKTIWAWIDKRKEEYDSLAFKKITGSVAFKAITLILLLGYLFFTMYGNLTGIRLQDSDFYKIHYNKKADEYYIVPSKEETQLELFVPIGTDRIVFAPTKNGAKADEKIFTPEEYQEKGYSITADEYDYIHIDARRKGKSADKVKIFVVSKERLNYE